MTVLTRTIARCLGGDVTGPNQVLVPGPGHSRRDRSLSIRIDPHAPGGFLVHSFSGDDPIEAKNYVRSRLRKAGWYLVEDRAEEDCESPRWQALADETQEPQGSVAQDDAYAAQQLSKAHSMWRASVPIAGTPAEYYLRQARGCSGTLPRTLRYLPPSKPDHHPAVIAAYGLACESEPGVLAIPDDRVTCVQLTLIRPDGSWKAGTGRDKLSISKSAGSPIVLAPPNDLLGLGITEGIEDALSIHAATGLGAWAAGGASRFPALARAVPQWIDWITIFLDLDPAGQTYAPRLHRELRRRGFNVSICSLLPSRIVWVRESSFDASRCSLLAPHAAEGRG